MVYKILHKLNTMQFYKYCYFLLLLKALILKQLQLKCMYKRSVSGHFSFLMSLSPDRDLQAISMEMLVLSLAVPLLVQAVLAGLVILASNSFYS